MEWWKKAVIYQIYPRSFQDSNHDGIGDLEGIISRLDYLKGKPDSLGIDAIWLSPIYPSPNFDFGYDISNYESIDPIYGDLNSFKILLREAHKRKIKIIMDLVTNHTSHLHPWFLESRSSKTNPKRDWYIWKDPVEGKPPNNWLGTFGGSAWTFDEKTMQYYYHSFLAEQPDLNWRNPQVKKAVFQMIKKWLDLGVDGFRLDVVNLYIKDEEYRNNDSFFWKGIRPFDRQVHIYDRDRPEMHGILRDLRKLLDSYGDRMSVGEVMQDYPGNVELPSTYYGNNDELHLAFNFKFLYSSWNAKNFYRIVNDFEKALGPKNWPNYTLSNHDFPRHISRYAKKGETLNRAKIAAMMLLCLRGTPFLYYGEEIGMEREKVPKKRILDPVGIRYWPLHPGRDPERKPFPWDDTEFGGFSTVEPWLPIYSQWKTNNLQTEKKKPNSIWNLYKSLIKIRNFYKCLQEGEQKLHLFEPENVLLIQRKLGKESIVTVLNFSNKEIEIKIPAEIKFQLEIISSLKNEYQFDGKKTKSRTLLSENVKLLPLEGKIFLA